jgi:hypothetical protein
LPISNFSADNQGASNFQLESLWGENYTTVCFLNFVLSPALLNSRYFGTIQPG